LEDATGADGWGAALEVGDNRRPLAVASVCPPHPRAWCPPKLHCWKIQNRGKKPNKLKIIENNEAEFQSDALIKHNASKSNQYSIAL